MFIAPVKTRSRRGFTLLEIMLAVGIMAMMSLAIYRFVEANLAALRVSSESSLVDAQYSGFANLVAAEWQSLPAGRGAMLGEPLKLNERSRDEISWTTHAGPGLLTRYAAGEYQLTMKLQPMKKGELMEIGFERAPREEAEIGESEEESWVGLLPNVESLQIRYFDPRLNTWVDKWTDTVTLPRLVKVTIGRPENVTPWEAIIALGRTPF